MKKTIINLAILSAFSFAFASCGGGKEDENNKIDSALKADSIAVAMAADSAEKAAANVDYSKLTGSEAISQYKTMLDEYNSLLESGNTDEAKALKASLDALNAAAAANLVGDELKALNDMAALSLRLEAGEDVNLDDALKATDALLDMTKDLPMDAETKEAMDAAGASLDVLQGMGGN
jgi:hypothetical protein